MSWYNTPIDPEGSEEFTHYSPFGHIDGMHHRGQDDGGTHHTVYVDGIRISWDTDEDGEYEDDSIHMMND